MKEILFLALALLLLVGCQLQNGDQYAKIYCKNKSFENTEIRTKTLQDGSYQIDCDYTDADKLEEIQTINQTAKDKFVIKIVR